MIKAQLDINRCSLFVWVSGYSYPEPESCCSTKRENPAVHCHSHHRHTAITTVAAFRMCHNTGRVSQSIEVHALKSTELMWIWLHGCWAQQANNDSAEHRQRDRRAQLDTCNTITKLDTCNSLTKLDTCNTITKTRHVQHSHHIRHMQHSYIPRHVQHC